MKTKITDESKRLLAILEPSADVEKFDRDMLFSYLLKNELFVSVEYRAVDDYNNFHWLVVPTGYTGSGGRDVIGFRDYYTAFDKGLEYGLCILVDRKQKAEEKAEIERQRKEKMLITRKEAEQAMLCVVDEYIFDDKPINYEEARKIFNQELDKLKNDAH